MKRIILASAFLSCASLSITSTAAPMDFDFSGTFTNDNDVVLLDFSVASDSTVTIFSSSWLSPDEGNGFDPILAIWDSSGNLIEEQDDGEVVGSTESNGVTYNHGTWDSYFTQFLVAGSYQASITQYDNFAVSTSLADGFERNGNPNFTFDENFGGATQALFNGVWDDSDPRTGAWEFHILNVDTASGPGPAPAPVPAPATLALFGLGLAGLGWRNRRKKA